MERAARQGVIERAFVVGELIRANFFISRLICAVVALREADVRFKKLKLLAVFGVVVEVKQLVFVAVDDDITARHVEMKILKIFNPDKCRATVFKADAFGNARAVIIEHAAAQGKIQRAFVKGKFMFAKFLPAHVKDNSHHKFLRRPKFQRRTNFYPRKTNARRRL